MGSASMINTGGWDVAQGAAPARPTHRNGSDAT